MEDRSITDVKASFLRSQIRLLSAPLQTPSQWRAFLPQPEGGHLSDKVVQDVVTKVNDKIKSHTRLVYPAQSQRHIAEQIETLHWQRVKSDTVDTAETDAVAVERRAELTATDTVAELPDHYADLFMQPETQLEIDERDESKYSELRARLVELSAARDAATLKLGRYRRVQELLTPYEQAQENVQPNLVTRDGDLARELDRMRVLVARVTARMGEAGVVGETDAMTARAMGLSGEEKLKAVMDLT